MKCKGKLCRGVFVIIPILVMLIIFFVTETIYRHNIDQSYDSLRKGKEFEIQRLVNETDQFMDYTQETELTEEQKFLIRFSVSELNRGNGVHCVLLDTNFNILKEYSEEVEDEDIKLVTNIHNNEEVRNLIKKETDGNLDNNHFELTVDDIKYDFYWQMIPTEHTEYYVLLGTTKSEIKPNRAIETCRIFVSILDVILAISLYSNIYLSDHNIGEDRRKSNKK